MIPVPENWTRPVEDWKKSREHPGAYPGPLKEEELKKTTDKHLAAFEKEARFWIEKLGLLDWEIAFEREDLDTRAQLTRSYIDKCAGFFLAKEWPCAVTPLNTEEVRKSAKHEVVELVVSELAILAEAPYKTADEVAHARHTLVRRLENIL